MLFIEYPCFSNYAHNYCDIVIFTKKKKHLKREKVLESFPVSNVCLEINTREQ